MSILKKIFSHFLYASLLFSGITLLTAQAPPAREYEIKAVFLFNFTQFVEWPPEAYPAPGLPVVIGVLGGDRSFSNYLEEVVVGEEVRGHPIAVKRFDNIEKMEGCHILFISRTEIKKLKHIVAGLKGKSILTVSDADNFMEMGGMIRFVTVDKKVRFQINPDVAKAAKLDISSKLLSLAEIVSLGKKK